MTLVVTLGSTIQGTIGFGLGLFAAPLLLLIDPQYVPGPLLLASAVLTLLLTRREWAGVRGRDLGWSLGARVVGTVIAVGLLKVLSGEQLDRLFGAVILTGVAITASGIRLRPMPGTLVAAGTLSGIMGTTTSVGGPPMALLYQNESGPAIRGTLSAYFVVGVLMSVLALIYAGRFGMLELHYSLLMVPGVLLGFAVSKRTSKALDGKWLRPAVLAVSAAAAVAVLV